MIGTDRETMVEILDQSIKIATGNPEAAARPGQRKLAEDILDVQGRTEHLAGIGPTGIGKSFSYSVAAFARAAIHGERTVISTESIKLQQQLVHKDLPVVAAATEAVTGVRPAFALMMGWANYVCLATAINTAAAVLRTDAATIDTVLAINKLDPTPGSDGLGTLVAQIEMAVADSEAANSGETLIIDRASYDFADVGRLVAWAIAESATAGQGHKHAYTGTLTEAMWSLVSLSKTECVGKDCPMMTYCLPHQSRIAAAAADVIVTNHHTLGIQASKGYPILIGSARIGHIDHIIVDEAHALADTVRSQGATKVSSSRMRSCIWAMTGVFGEGDARADKFSTSARPLMDRLDSALDSASATAGRVSSPPIIRGETNPIGVNLSAHIDGWLGSGIADLKTAKASAGWRMTAKIGGAIDRLAKLADDLVLVCDHADGIARWVEPAADTRTGSSAPASAQASPVDVSSLIRNNLWTGVIPEPPITEADWINGVRPHEAGLESDRISASDWSSGIRPLLAGPGTEMIDVADWQAGVRPRITYPLSVTLVSATLPERFARSVGADVEAVPEYPSPFDSTYAHAAFYQSPGSADCAPLDWNDRPKFSLPAHQSWAASEMVDLVEANGGSALILSASKSGGEAYTVVLRNAAAGRWTVLSQWDPEGSTVIQRWKDDPASVLVGTKSFFTGLDASGDTNTLVIIDRVPRKPQNPVDEERVAQSGRDKWSGAEQIYAGDASLLLEQGYGRLIRSISDRGMVALLDPRMHGRFVAPYKRGIAHTLYRRASRRFENRIGQLDQAVAFLVAERLIRTQGGGTSAAA